MQVSIFTSTWRGYSFRRTCLHWFQATLWMRHHILTSASNSLSSLPTISTKWWEKVIRSVQTSLISPTDYIDWLTWDISSLHTNKTVQHASLLEVVHWHWYNFPPPRNIYFKYGHRISTCTVCLRRLKIEVYKTGNVDESGNICPLKVGKVFF